MWNKCHFSPGRIQLRIHMYSSTIVSIPNWQVNCKVEKNKQKNNNYLLHFGNITNESLIIHIVAETSQLVKVPDVVLTNPLLTRKQKGWVFFFQLPVRFVWSVCMKTELTSAMTSASPGLHITSQRRGVMPLVLFWNLCGSISKKSLKLQAKWTITYCISERTDDAPAREIRAKQILLHLQHSHVLYFGWFTTISGNFSVYF